MGYLIVLVYVSIQLCISENLFDSQETERKGKKKKKKKKVHDFEDSYFPLV